MPQEVAREIAVPGTELRLPGKSFICYQLTSVVTEQHCVRENGQPDRRARSFASALDRGPSRIEEGTVSSGRTLFHRRGQGPSERGHIGAVRPCQANTARHVFMIAASTRSAGSIPAPTGMNSAGAPSVIRVGALSPVRQI